MLRVPALCLTAVGHSTGRALPGSRPSTKKIILLVGVWSRASWALRGAGGCQSGATLNRRDAQVERIGSG